MRSGAVALSVSLPVILLLPIVAGTAEPAALDVSKLPPPAQTKVDFKRDIEPILAKSCHECHGPGLKESGLALHRRTDAMAGGDRGPAIVPDKSGESRLIRYVSGLDETLMPPDGEGEPLSAAQVSLLRAWIDQGAAWPDDDDVATKSDHWAYKKPVRRALPTVSLPSWPKTPLDYFVLARLDAESLRPSPEVDRARWIRRVSLDLIGLPPSIEEVDAFLADRSDDAYEKVVDRLLASPHYGERWARPWLDLARYADTHGYEKDPRRSMWPYRDWVIDALNSDMPFSQFTIEQIAGDLLPSATLAQRVATGFHRNTMINTEGGVDGEEYRVAAVVDRVNTTATVWLGTTLGCAQCHSHKYDPFKQREYYEFFAFFNSTTDTGNADGPQVTVPTPAVMATQAEIAKLEAVLQTSTPEVEAAQLAWEKGAAEHGMSWTVLAPSSMTSAVGATFTAQGDGSILVTGNQGIDTYTLTADTTLSGITAIRLEALTDPSLPASGPGRAGNGNFVVSELQVKAAPKGDPSKQRDVAWASATADFSQGGYQVAAAIDGNADTGWAVSPHFGQSHEAVFETKEDIVADGGATLTFNIVQKYSDGQHSLGRFRLSATDAKRPLQSRHALPAEIAAILPVPLAERTDGQRRAVAAYYRTVAPELKAVREKLAELQKANRQQLVQTLVMQELPAARKTHVLAGGNFLNPGLEVSAAVPAVLNPLPADGTRNRLLLAQWLVDPENPLTARVMMNRIWEQCFGRGLVLTSEDFGSQGEPPSHLELLDWLADEFMRQGWSMKAMHRLIALSAAYRQSSTVTLALLERDPHNRLMARGPRVRLEAEMIRDQALAASGLLSRKVGGASVMPPQPDGVWSQPYSGDRWSTSSGDDKHRRGLYTFWRRTAPYPAFMSFDAPSREFCVVRRPRTNTPLQALTTLNDPVYVEAAQALARRMMAEASAGTAERATYGFRLCLSRQPTVEEVQRLMSLHERELSHFRLESKAATAMTAGSINWPSDSDVSERAAWTVVGNVLLNLDEFITK